MDDWFLYIVRCSDGSLYTGISNNVEARIHKHNEGKGARYTNSRLPVVLEYSERVGTYGDALRREARIKKLGKIQKEYLIKKGPGN